MTQQLDDAQVIDSHFMGRIFFTVSHIFILLSLQQSNADIRQDLDKAQVIDCISFHDRPYFIPIHFGF
jgi:hypothetical protein